MNFLEAVELMLDGKEICNKEWPDKNARMRIWNGRFYYTDKHNDDILLTDSCLPLHDDDSMTHGWEVYRELIDFKSAVKNLMDGKTISREAWCNGNSRRIIQPNHLANILGEFSKEDVDAEDWVVIDD